MATGQGYGMTNEQLGILVAAWAKRLAIEIDDLRKQLPGNMERLPVREYTGKALLPFIDQDETHWREVPGEFTCLSGLLDLLEELQSAVNSLMPEKTIGADDALRNPL